LESDIEYFKVQKTEIGSSEKKISKRKTFKNEKIATCYFNAKVLLENNEPALAVNLLRFCASNDSFNSYILDSLYESLRKSYQLEEAEKVAEQNLNYNYSLKRCFELANIYFFNDRDEEALKLYFDCLSNIIEDQLVLFEIYKNMANIYVKFREFDSAEEYYYKAYQINNSSDLLLVNIGVLEFQKKDLEKSRHCFRRAIEINNKNDKAWVGLAMTHIEYGDRDLSWGNLIKALDLNSNNKTALILMCQFYNKTEKNLTCKEYLLKYLEKNNFDEEVSILLIQNLIHAGEYENAYLESFKNYIWNPKNEENKKVYIELKNYLEGAV
jgi:tetratricopeptide (TPR) repeat protein